MLDKVRYDVTALLVFSKIVAPRFITLPSVDLEQVAGLHLTELSTALRLRMTLIARGSLYPY